MPENKRHIMEVEEPDRSPSSIKAQRFLPLETDPDELADALMTVPDDLDDATHKDFDILVVKRVIDVAGYEKDEELDLGGCRTILFAIVEKSEGRLDCDGKKANALLREYPELVNRLKAAWADQSFRNIRNLAILRRPNNDAQTCATADLDTVLDDIPAEMHVEFDKRVIEAARRAGNTADPAFILFFIAQESNGKLDVSKAMELLAESPRLVNMVKTAWKLQSFKNIRNLAILRSQPRTQSSADVVALEKAVAMAWHGNFEGNYHQLLLQNLNEMWYNKRHLAYSNSVAIIQSSGSGKSRMVDEQAKLVFTLPFNLRQSAEDKGFAYPSPDVRVRDYLTQVMDSFETTRIRFVFFFKLLLSAVKEELQRKFGNDPIKLPEDKFATAWRKHLDSESNRSRLYDQVVKRCEVEWKTIKKNQDAEAKQSLKELVDTIEKHCDLQAADRNFRVLLYFDEAHVLADITTADKQDNIKYDHFQALSSALTSFIGDPVFAVFLSTHSSLSLLAPPSKLCRSARARDTRDCLQAPITETPFDCSPSLLIKPGQLRLSDISKIEFLVQFGRPMFWSMLDASTEKDAVCRSMIAFARSKLTCSQLLDLDETRLKPEVLAILLDVLIMLDFEPRHEASHHYQVEAVASHMRTAYSVPAHRTYLRSGYPSEPILAEAAAHGIRHAQAKEDTRNDVMAAALLYSLNCGLISLGERGEVVMRLILIQAYMNAVVKENPSGPTFIFSKGCHVSTFIEELFTDNYAKDILNSTPDNVPGNTRRGIKLGEAFKKSILRFTHFAKAADKSVLDMEAIFPAFVRGMAFIGSTTQEAVDLIIPILLDSDLPLEASAMSVLLVQVKRRKGPGPVNKYLIDEAKFPLFPPLVSGKDRPYLTLVAELGIGDKTKVSSTQPRSQTPERSRVHIPPDTPSKLEVNMPPQRQGGRSHENAHPRYSIRAYGCSGSVYKVISPYDKAVYQALLAKGDLFSEHARQNHDSLVAVRRLKPLWRSGVPFHWVESRIRDEKGEEEVEHVEAGQATYDD